MNSDGIRWQKMRRAAMEAFHSDHLKGNVAHMQKFAQEAADPYLACAGGAGEGEAAPVAVDIKAVLCHYAASTLATIVLGEADDEFLAACAALEAACLRRTRFGRWWWLFEWLGYARVPRWEVNCYLKERIAEVPPLPPRAAPRLGQLVPRGGPLHAAQGCLPGASTSFLLYYPRGPLPTPTAFPPPPAPS
jgi:cytochrome P450